MAFPSRKNRCHVWHFCAILSKIYSIIYLRSWTGDLAVDIWVTRARCEPACPVLTELWGDRWSCGLPNPRTLSGVSVGVRRAHIYVSGGVFLKTPKGIFHLWMRFGILISLWQDGEDLTRSPFWKCARLYMVSFGLYDFIRHPIEGLLWVFKSCLSRSHLSPEEPCGSKRRGGTAIILFHWAALSCTLIIFVLYRIEQWVFF